MSVYEQIKDDLGYLQLDRAVECFATLAEDARTQDWTHIEFLARLVAEQADATRNRRLAARLRYARFPFRKTINDFEFQPTIDRRLVDDLATLRFMDTGRPIQEATRPTTATFADRQQSRQRQRGHDLKTESGLGAVGGGGSRRPMGLTGKRSHVVASRLMLLVDANCGNTPARRADAPVLSALPTKGTG